MNEATAASTAKQAYSLRPGLTSITPYNVITKAAEFIEFLTAAFGAAERLHVPTPDGKIMHRKCELEMARLKLVMPTKNTRPPQPTFICTWTTPIEPLTGRSKLAPLRSTGRPMIIRPAIAGAPSKTRLGIAGSLPHIKEPIDVLALRKGRGFRRDLVCF